MNDILFLLWFNSDSVLNKREEWDTLHTGQILSNIDVNENLISPTIETVIGK